MSAHENHVGHHTRFAGTPNYKGCKSTGVNARLENYVEVPELKQQATDPLH